MTEQDCGKVADDRLRPFVQIIYNCVVYIYICPTQFTENPLPIFGSQEIIHLISQVLEWERKFLHPPLHTLVSFEGSISNLSQRMFIEAVCNLQANSQGPQCQRQVAKHGTNKLGLVRTPKHDLRMISNLLFQGSDPLPVLSTRAKQCGRGSIMHLRV